MLQNPKPSQQTPQPCFDCGQPSDPTLLGYYQICLKCYQAQVKSVLQYKASRTVFYPQMDEILPHLYLGNEDAACNEKFIDTYKIGAVLVCGNHLESPFQKRLAYKKFMIADDPKQQILNLLPEAYEWMEEHINKNTNILVHCAAGISRSASFVIAYVMKKNKMGLKQAHEFVKSRRSVIFPNSGFLLALQTYQKQLFPENETKTVQKHDQLELKS